MIQYISIVLFFICFVYVMRYNIHMFQLNGYKNDEHFKWVRKNIKKQGLLFLMVIPLLCVFLMNEKISLVLNLVFITVCLKYYLYLKKTNNKKKLVYTARVKRLISTDVMIVLLSILPFLRIDNMADYKVCGIMIMIMLQPYVIILVNIINSPIENLVKKYYINDAKKILQKNKELIVIGVTGSYGKTSVKFYLETLLKERFEVLVTPESYNTPMGVVKTIRESLKNTHEIFVCEMGARRVGDIKEICDIVHPKHGIITAVGPQHLETFLSIENISNTKFELADALPEDGMLVLNGDNELILNKSNQYKNVCLYTSSANDVSYKVENITLTPTGTHFTVVAPDGESCEFQTRLIGEHNVINILGAITIANKLGIALKDLKIPVRRIQAVPHRMQIINKNNFTIIDDAFNSNPAGSKVAVETLKMFNGLRILITPGMVELGEMEEELNCQFGKYAADCCDYIYLVGKKRTEPILRGITEGKFDLNKCFVCDSFNEAMTKATALKCDEHKYILLENDLPDNY